MFVSVCVFSYTLMNIIKSKLPSHFTHVTNIERTFLCRLHLAEKLMLCLYPTWCFPYNLYAWNRWLMCNNNMFKLNYGILRSWHFNNPVNVIYFVAEFLWTELHWYSTWFLFFYQFSAANPEYVRYAKDISITVSLYDTLGNGRIYPPYWTITYDQVSRTAALAGATVTVSGMEI